MGKLSDICDFPQNQSRNVWIGLSLDLGFVHFLSMLKLPRKNLRTQRRKKEVKVRKKTAKKPKRMRKKLKVLGRSKQPRRKIEPPFP